ncbi:MAG: YdeI/OmpD-associated family protein [Anaerolineae bacterium]|nr:YdeI/OmpD-associated family protein [Anaerolineae bacterium]
MDVVFFETADAWRAWLEAHHDTETEVMVGFYRKDSGRQSVTYPEAVEQALCFGWIDGVRRSIDDLSYANRFTPRKPKSNWSQVNIRHVERLTAAGLMHEAGLKAFNERDPEKQNRYSFERENGQLDPAYEAQFRANEKAWAHFMSRPPSYRKPAIWWVMSAKQEATRLKRLATLIDDSAAGRKIAVMRRKNEQE